MTPVIADRFRALQRVLLDVNKSVASSIDGVALQALSPLVETFLPWNAAALRPSAALAIVNDIVINRHHHVVELGAGISTVLAAKTLAPRDGHLYSVEDDPGWADVVRGWLEAEGVADRVTFVIAPIEHGWYSKPALEPIPGQIELLVVDGPIAAAQPLARLPALPHFAPRLAERATVVLDDINRPGEQEILDRWEAEQGRRFERRMTNGSIGISLAPESYYV
jgi:predicted O-methyltransferase YrrM